MKAAQTDDWGRGNKTKNQHVIGEMPFGCKGLLTAHPEGDRDKAGSNPRLVPSSIWRTAFFLVRSKLDLFALQRNSVLFFLKAVS